MTTTMRTMASTTTMMITTMTCIHEIFLPCVTQVSHAITDDDKDEDEDDNDDNDNDNDDNDNDDDDQQQHQ